MMAWLHVEDGAPVARGVGDYIGSPMYEVLPEHGLALFLVVLLVPGWWLFTSTRRPSRALRFDLHHLRAAFSARWLVNRTNMPPLVISNNGVTFSRTSRGSSSATDSTWTARPSAASQRTLGPATPGSCAT